MKITNYEEMSLSVRVTKKMYKRNSFQKHQELSLKIPIHITKNITYQGKNLQRPLLIDLKKAVSETCLISHRGV